MREFFRGWRRKVGCAMLVLALTLMVLWLRSIHTKDFVRLVSFDDWQCALLSLEGSIVFNILQGLTDRPVDQGLPKWFAYRIDGSEMNNPGIIWKWRWCGFGHISPDSRSIQWVISYWSIVLLLTTLSAYLLLSQPRKPSSVPGKDVS